MKILQLNIEKGKYLDTVLDFLVREDIDIACVQEVGGGAFSQNGEDCFAKLLSLPGYQGERAPIAGIAGDPASYIGNALLWRTPFAMQSKEVTWLKDYKEYPDTNIDPKEVPRNVLAVRLKHEDKEILAVSTHLAWGPTPLDEPYKLEQGEKLHSWLAGSVHGPFVLAGDFNLTGESRVVLGCEVFGRNLTKEYRISNTLNPTTHRLHHLFPAGLAVDYMFVHKDAHVQSFQVTKEDLSDHLGLLCTLDF